MTDTQFYYTGISYATEKSDKLPNGGYRGNFKIAKFNDFLPAKNALIAAMMNAMEDIAVDQPDNWEQIVLDLLQMLTEIDAELTPEKLVDHTAFVNAGEYIHLFCSSEWPPEGLEDATPDNTNPYWEIVADHSECTENHCTLEDAKKDGNDDK